MRRSGPGGAGGCRAEGSPPQCHGYWPQWVGCRRLSVGGSGVPNWLLATHWLVLTSTHADAGGNSTSCWPADSGATAPGTPCQLSVDLSSTASTRSVVLRDSRGPPPTTRAWSRSLVFLLRWPRPRPPMSEAGVLLDGTPASPKPIGGRFFPTPEVHQNWLSFWDQQWSTNPWVQRPPILSPGGTYQVMRTDIHQWLEGERHPHFLDATTVCEMG